MGWRVVRDGGGGESSGSVVPWLETERPKAGPSASLNIKQVKLNIIFSFKIVVGFCCRAHRK